jgi:hypothetical protein
MRTERTKTHVPIHHDRLAVLRPRLAGGAVDARLHDYFGTVRIGGRSEARRAARTRLDGVPRNGRRSGGAASGPSCERPFLVCASSAGPDLHLRVGM